MECRDAQFYLRFSSPGANDLAPEDTAALARHLADCSPCSAEARSVSAFDAAVGRAMRAVEVPTGLRARLIASTSAQRGTMLRRRLGRSAAVAASLLLALGIGIGALTSRRPQPDTAELAMKGNDLARMLPTAPIGFAVDPQRAQNNEAAVRNWLKAEHLPDLPESFDYGLLVEYHWEEVQGRKVPVVHFRGREQGFAKVYAFRATQFNLKDVQEAQYSDCQAKPYPIERSGVTFVIVFTGLDLNQFLKGRAPGGPSA